jgi:hypothetical protein
MLLGDDARTIDLATARARIEAAVYQAAIATFEPLGGAGRLHGNAAHAAQKVALYAVEQLIARWPAEAESEGV